MSFINNLERPAYKSVSVMMGHETNIPPLATLDSQRQCAYHHSTTCFDSTTPHRTRPISKEEDFACTLTLESLPDEPIFYYTHPRNHEMISDSNPSIIAANIKDCLRRLSIKATYDNKTATIHAETCEHVKFDIHFYRCKTEPGSSIVEIHRLNSSSFGFRDVVRMIFESAKGAHSTPNLTSVTRRLSLPWIVPDTVRDRIAVDHDEIGLSALEEGAILLNKDRHDANELGIESMMFLTNCTMTIETIASMAADAILHGKYACEDLQSKIYNLVKCGKMYDDKDCFDDDICAAHYERMRRGALTVLYNSLDTASRSSCVDVSEIADSMWCGEPMCAVLLQDLADAPSNPHDAHLAAKCLNSMMKASDHFLQQVKGINGVLSILEGAANTGRSCHALLCDESHQVIQTFKA